MTTKNRGGGDLGFSFIELLAYMAIAALLILAAVPQFDNYRGAARDATTMSDVKIVALAMEGWSVDHPGEAFPKIFSNWGTLESEGAMSALGVTLSTGTSLWVMDRTDWAATAGGSPSSIATHPGMAFCISAHNVDGKKYVNSASGKRIVYYSGSGGLGDDCLDAIDRPE